jgi:hypothetical protein
MVALSTLLLLCFSLTTLIQLFCLVRILVEHRRSLEILDSLLAEAIKKTLDEISGGRGVDLEGREAPNPAVMFLLDMLKENMAGRNKQGQFEKVIEIAKAD